MTVIDMNTFKSEKNDASRLEDLIDLSKSLQACYKLLRPFFRYKHIFRMGKDIVDFRKDILNDIKSLKEK